MGVFRDVGAALDAILLEDQEKIAAHGFKLAQLDALVTAIDGRLTQAEERIEGPLSPPF